MVYKGNLFRWNSRDKGRADEHELVLVVGHVEEMMGLQNVGWFQPGNLWAGAICSGQGIGIAMSTSREVEQGKIELEEE